MATKTLFVRFSFALCCSALVLLSAAACTSAKDAPMPLTQNNIEKYSKFLLSEAKNIDPTAGTPVDRITKVYKISMSKMGYSFDKTIKYMMININQLGASPATNAFLQMMSPAYTTVIDQSDEALKKGLITQGTFDLMAAAKTAGEPMSDEEYKYISVVVDCQKENGNVCKMPKFLELLAKKGLLPQDIINREVEIYDLRGLTYDFMNKSDFQRWGMRDLIRLPNGDKIDHGIAPEDSNLSFVVNVQKIDDLRKYSQLLAEEQRTLTSK